MLTDFGCLDGDLLILRQYIDRLSPCLSLLLELLLDSLVLLFEVPELLHPLLLLPHQTAELLLEGGHLGLILGLVAQLCEVFLKIMCTSSESG